GFPTGRSPRAGHFIAQAAVPESQRLSSLAFDRFRLRPQSENADPDPIRHPLYRCQVGAVVELLPQLRHLLITEPSLPTQPPPCAFISVGHGVLALQPD